MDIGRSSWAEIDLDNLKHNLSEVRKTVGKKTRVMGVVKANAYGHGSVRVAKSLAEEGVDLFGVALLSEALELKRGGIVGDIMILGYTPFEQFEVAIENGIILTVYDLEGAEAISLAAKRIEKTAKVHIKIDSGMGRLGFRIGDKSIGEIVAVNNLDRIEIDGFFTHFATSDESDKSYSEQQFKLFEDTLKSLEERGVEIKNRHVSNSGAIIDLHRYTLDIVRPGIMLYGYYPSDEVSRSEIKLKRVMTLKTKVSNLKYIEAGESVGYGRAYIAENRVKVGTVPIGYGDGFTRLLSGKISLKIKGRNAQLIGNICMDQSMVDCTSIENVNIGDEVTVFGCGENVNGADDIAGVLGTISYEVLCMVGMRVPRVYISKDGATEVDDYIL